MELTKEEILSRIKRLRLRLDETAAGWKTALIFGRINQYYLTGTMQDGVFALKSNGEFAYFVRRSFQRAQMEAKISEIYQMTSYRDMQSFLGEDLGNLYLEKDIVNLTILDRLQKIYRTKGIYGIDPIMARLRAVKSPYELSKIRKSGKQHEYIMETAVPKILREGMTETEFFGELYSEMLKAGYQGLARFSMFQTEMALGQFGFGASAVYPTSFDGPGGMKGMSPAVPLVGDPSVRLKKGDLVFVDIAFGCDGYHTDRTQIYMYGADVPDELAEAHKKCIEVERAAASMLKPGAIPGDIYEKTVLTLSEDFRKSFMGIGNELVKFLGHGVGLHIDEYPVIASGFKEALEENMVIALEPKKSFPGIGIVGVEDTYLVTNEGGECLTRGEKEIMVVK